MYLLHRHRGTEADAFWETYGQPDKSPEARIRQLMYQGRSIGGARLEHHRLRHNEAVKRSYLEMQTTLEALKCVLGVSVSKGENCTLSRQTLALQQPRTLLLSHKDAMLECFCHYLDIGLSKDCCVGSRDIINLDTLFVREVRELD